MSTNTYIDKINRKVEKASKKYKTKILAKNKQTQLTMHNRKALITRKIKEKMKFDLKKQVSI